MAMAGQNLLLGNRLRRTQERKGPDAVLLAGRCTLLDQSGLDEPLPLCAGRGIGVMAAGVFQSGLLADPKPGAAFGYDDVPKPLLTEIARLRQICDTHGVPALAAAIQSRFGIPRSRLS